MREYLQARLARRRFSAPDLPHVLGRRRGRAARSASSGRRRPSTTSCPSSSGRCAGHPDPNGTGFALSRSRRIPPRPSGGATGDDPRDALRIGAGRGSSVRRGVDRFTFDSEFPFTLRSWARSDGGSLTLRKAQRLDYWNHGRPGRREAPGMKETNTPSPGRLATLRRHTLSLEGEGRGEGAPWRERASLSEKSGDETLAAFGPLSPENPVAAFRDWYRFQEEFATGTLLSRLLSPTISGPTSRRSGSRSSPRRGRASRGSSTARGRSSARRVRRRTWAGRGNAFAASCWTGRGKRARRPRPRAAQPRERDRGARRYAGGARRSDQPVPRALLELRTAEKEIARAATLHNLGLALRRLAELDPEGGRGPSFRERRRAPRGARAPEAPGTLERRCFDAVPARPDSPAARRSGGSRSD